MSNLKVDAAALGRVAVVYNPAPEECDGDEGEPPSFVADAEVVETAGAVVEALTALGAEAIPLCLDADPEITVARLRALRVDRVFNLVEAVGGDASREAEFPALLERARLPYTGNGPGILELAQDKNMARRALRAGRVPVAAGFMVTEEPVAPPGMAYPLFVKPARADGSIGIDAGSVVRNLAEYRARVVHLLRHLGPVVVEAYLPGPEVNVAVVPADGSPLLVPTVIDFTGYPPEIPPIVTYACKWVPGSPEYVARSVDAREVLDARMIEAAVRVAGAAFVALGGSGYGRVDLRFDANDLPRVIDVNPNPDLHPEAGFALAAALRGVEFSALTGRIAAEAGLQQMEGARHVDEGAGRDAGRRQAAGRQGGRVRRATDRASGSRSAGVSPSSH